MIAVVHCHAINSRTYVSVPYHAARMLNQLRRGHRAWAMVELKSGAAMAAPAAPMPPPLLWGLVLKTEKVQVLILFLEIILTRLH